MLSIEDGDHVVGIWWGGDNELNWHGVLVRKSGADVWTFANGYSSGGRMRFPRLPIDVTEDDVLAHVRELADLAAFAVGPVTELLVGGDVAALIAALKNNRAPFLFGAGAVA
jgi:hypothetical protein